MKTDELVNLYYSEMNENERYICQYLYENRKDFCRDTIDETAKKCGVSKSLLVRFAKHLGLSGFRELKAMLRIEEQENKVTEWNLLETMTESYHKMLDDFLKRDYSRIFESLYHAERVVVYGSGSSQARVASEMKRIFLPEKKLIDLYGHDMCQAIEKNIHKEDMVFLISLSGEADYMINLAKRLRVKGAFLVSVTRMSNNPLSVCCDENLYIESVHAEVGEYGDYESTTPYFILIELLYLAYQNYLAGKSDKKENI